MIYIFEDKKEDTLSKLVNEINELEDKLQLKDSARKYRKIKAIKTNKIFF